MGKTQRCLWELNNFYRRHWGQPEEPEPEDGFAQEQFPPGFPDVFDWFRDAIPEHCRKLPVPRTDIARIARLVGEFQAMLAQPYNPRIEIGIKKSVCSVPVLNSKKHSVTCWSYFRWMTSAVIHR